MFCFFNHLHIMLCANLLNQYSTTFSFRCQHTFSVASWSVCFLNSSICALVGTAVCGRYMGVVCMISHRACCMPVSSLNSASLLSFSVCQHVTCCFNSRSISNSLVAVGCAITGLVHYAPRKRDNSKSIFELEPCLNNITN